MEKESSMLFKLKETIFSPLVLFGFLILAGFIFSGLMFKSGLSDISVLTNANGITVSGTAERFVKSDRGSIILSLTTSSLDISNDEAQEQLSVAREALVKYLVTKGIDEKEIDVLPYTSSLECSMRQSNNWENCLGKKYAEYSQILNLASNKEFSRLPPRIALIVKIMDRMTLQPLRRKSLQLFVLALR